MIGPHFPNHPLSRLSGCGQAPGSAAVGSVPGPCTAPGWAPPSRILSAAPSGASWLLCDSEAPSVITINQKEESQGYHQPCRDDTAQEPNYGNYRLEETGAARERSESTLRALVRVCLGRKNGNTPPLISLLHRREQFKCKR